MQKTVFLFGGPGVECEVSIASARSALPHFSADHRILPIFITGESFWVVADAYVDPKVAWSIAETLMTKTGVPAEIALDGLEESKPDVVFIGLHGEYGEDGQVQKLLADRSLLFTGSDAEASALAMEKPKVLQLLQDEGIATPDFLEVIPDISDRDVLAFADHIGYPVFVLPADRGSSVGIIKVLQSANLLPAIVKVRAISPRVMLSGGLTGMEVTCGLLVTEKDVLTVLPPTEIVPAKQHDFWNYEAKYSKGESDDITPARLTPEVLAAVQATGKRVHQLVGADGYSRVDMIVVAGVPHVLEINTLPGLTAMSILPQEAAVAGIDFAHLLALICAAAQSRVTN